MQRGLEQALDRAEYVIQSAQQRPPKRKYSPGGGKSLHDKLYDIYVEECGKEPEVTEDLMSNVNLLEKLVRRESLSSLVVSLYPGMGGYSLLLRGENGSYTESIRLPYEEGEFLDYLDAQELPPALVDLLEKSPVNLFYSGCVIAEIRDYRQCGHGDAPGVQSRHILLRPTMQTLVCDVESIASHNPDWTQEDKLLLESQLILATAEPLCLEPCVSVACTENRLLYNRQKMNTPPMRRNLRRHSTASLGGQHELPEQPAPPELSAWDFGHHSQERQAGQPGELTFSEAGKCVDTWKQRPCDLAVPSEVDVERYAKGRRSVPYEDSHPTVWPGYEVQEGPGFGGEAGDPFQTAKLMLMEPLNDPLISGARLQRKKARCESQIPSHHSWTDDYSNRFMPGSKTDAEGIVSQSEELVQMNTEWPITMSQSSSSSANLSLLPLGQEAEQPQATEVRPSVQGKGVKHAPPARSVQPSILGKGVKHAPPARSVQPSILGKGVKHAPPAKSVQPSVQGEGAKHAPLARSVQPAILGKGVKHAPPAKSVQPSVQGEGAKHAPLARSVQPAILGKGVKHAPPAKSVQPSVLGEGVKHAPPAKSLQPSVPGEGVKHAPPAKSVQPSVPGEGVKHAPPAKSVQPSVLGEGVKHAPPAKSVQPSVPGEGVKHAPPAKSVQPSVPGEGVKHAPPAKSVQPSVQGKGVKHAPPARSVQPSILGKGVKHAPPAKSVQPSVMGEGVKHAPPAKSVQPSVQGKGVKHAPPARSVQPSVPGVGIRQAPPATQLPLSSGKSSSGDKVTPQQASRFPKTKYRPLAAKPPSVPQQSFVEVKQVNTLPVVTLSTAVSSPRTAATQVTVSNAALNVIKVQNPVASTQTVMRVANPVMVSSAGARIPAGLNPSRLPTGGSTPQARAVVPPVVLETASDLKPFTVLQVPEGSLILKTQQQAPQPPQQVQQQWLYQMIPQPPPQPPPTFYLPQPVLQVSSAQVSARQAVVLPAQQAVLVNFSGVGTFLQPQTSVLSQPGSAQTRPVQTPPQLRGPLFSDFQQQQRQPQQVSLRVLRPAEPVAVAAAPTAQPHEGQGQSTAKQSKGEEDRCQSTTAKP